MKSTGTASWEGGLKGGKGRIGTGSGSLKDNDRRTELAKMIIKSEYLGKAIVNRMWGHFLGYGFTKPIDDMGPHNPPSHPELVDQLATEFSKHRYADDGYDLKQLMRWIVLSEPLNPVQIVGGVIVMAGIFIASQG